MVPKDKCQQIAKETTSFDVMDFNDFQDFYERFASSLGSVRTLELVGFRGLSPLLRSKGTLNAIPLQFAVCRYERQALHMKLKRPFFEPFCCGWHCALMCTAWAWDLARWRPVPPSTPGSDVPVVLSSFEWRVDSGIAAFRLG